MDELDLRLCATNDSLTGAMSRKAFKREVTRETSLALRHHHDLSVIAIDLDHFKSINDSFGHSAGDYVLARAIQVLSEELRDTDRIGRLGGEEFAVLLPNTRPDKAMEVAEKLRRAIADKVIEFGSKAIEATASFGVAALDQVTRDADVLLDHADKALYEAKQAGRNRVNLWQDSATPVPARRRVLKGGQIVFNGGTSSMDCTVRSLADDGAGIAISSSLGVPRKFRLSIKADDFAKECRVVHQTEKHIEVEFC